MNLLEVKQKLLNRKEFNTTDTRTRNRILNKIEEVKNNTELHEEQEGLLIMSELDLTNYIDKCISNEIFVAWCSSACAGVGACIGCWYDISYCSGIF